MDGEGARHTHEVTLDRLARPDATREDVLAQFATLTLGSGAAAMVLGRSDAHPEGHRLVGGVMRAATEHHELCIGDLESMQTDAKGLLDAGMAISRERCGEDAAAEFDWSDMDRYIAHQVSQAHTTAMCRTVGIDPSRVPVTFPTRGNMGPATIPFTLATQLDSLRADRSGAAHGRRLRHERRLHGSGLVSGARPHRAASKPPAGLPGLRPELVAAGHRDRRRRGQPHLARARQRGRGHRSGRCCACTATRRGPTCGGGSSPRRPRGGGWSPSTSSGWASPSARSAPAPSRSGSADLTAVTDALGVTGPVVTVGHDWGGPISLGWALAHRDRLRAVVLANTAVHQPADSAVPSLIRLARTPALRRAVCTATPTFVRVASALSRPACPPTCAPRSPRPTARAARRRAVGAFVADIPLEARARQRADAGRRSRRVCRRWPTCRC